MTKAEDVTAAVQEIIGLDYNQFSQIVLIAQGQFTKLLNASTEERSRIFRKLFRTQRYAQLQERLQARSIRAEPAAHRPERQTGQPAGRAAIQPGGPGRRGAARPVRPDRAGNGACLAGRPDCPAGCGAGRSRRRSCAPPKPSWTRCSSSWVLPRRPQRLAQQLAARQAELAAAKPALDAARARNRPPRRRCCAAGCPDRAGDPGAKRPCSL
ncbi:MAG: hypothetical protein ACLVJH_08575 [Faecalibacterium prausnitzii]